MSRHAIVIGIDSYANASWNLGAAVDDALRFTDWVLDRGGVEPENVRLLLSPKKRRETVVPYDSADSRTITRTILDFREGAGAGAERLYVYYGGHGLTAPGVADEPVLIPADVSEIAVDASRFVGFSQIITALNAVDPPTQFFFLDACRDFGLENFAPPLGRAVGPWDDRGEGARSNQFVLYATSPGQRAYEKRALGRGVFADALITILNGQHARAAPWSWQDRRYRVSFSTLSERVKAIVTERLERIPEAERYVQLPEAWSRGPDAAIVSFRADEIGKLPLRVRLGPSKARSKCRISLLTVPPGKPEGLPIQEVGPPSERSTKLEVLPGDYDFQAEATGYEVYRVPCSVYSPRTLDLKLALLQAEPEPAASLGGPGSLTVHCEDPTAVMVVRDEAREVKGTGTRTLTIDPIEPGIYRIQLLTVEGSTAEREAIVKPGPPPTEVTLEAPGPSLGKHQLEMLDRLGIHADGGYLHPSEHLDGVAYARLASLLAFAAFAAQWPGAGDFERLRAFGVRSFSALPRGQAGFLVLVGASGERPACYVHRDDFLANAEYVARDLEGQPLVLGPFELLAGLPTATQAGGELAPGCFTVELRLPGLAPTRYALAALPDRVSVLIAVAEDDGDVEVQQYLLPVRPDEHDYLSDSPTNIRRLEVAQRYYANHRDIPEGEALDHALDGLLAGKFLDPLLGALAGYGLLRAGRVDDYREPANRNMLERFGGLPDSHVLAALCEPERRDEHFAAALQLGLPVFADGFRALHAWLQERERDTKRPIWVQPSLLLPGSPWTAWVASRPVLRVEGGRFGRAPVGWDALERKRDTIERTTRSVGRVAPLDGSAPLVATAFLVAPDVAMTMSVAIEGRTPSELVLDFGDGDGSGSLLFNVEEVLGAGEPGTATELVALMRIASTSSSGETLPPPLPVAASLPERVEGRPVYVVGFPVADARAPEDVQRLFAGSVGVKWLQPGQLLSVSGVTFLHDCLTLRGSGGSPVIDIETGLVIGLHYAGLWTDYKRGEAVALWAVRDDPLLAQAGIRFEPSHRVTSERRTG